MTPVRNDPTFPDPRITDSDSGLGSRPDLDQGDLDDLTGTLHPGVVPRCRSTRPGPETGVPVLHASGRDEAVEPRSRTRRHLTRMSGAELSTPNEWVTQGETSTSR